MTDERASFEQTRARLEEILVHVRKKDTSLEQSLDLLEEGVRLANACNELIDQTSWRQSDEAAPGEEEAEAETADAEQGPDAGAGELEATAEESEPRLADDERS